MGLGKSALVRYRIIDEALTSKAHPFPSLNHLIERVNNHLVQIGDDRSVSRRTIQKDLQDMRVSAELGYYAPIEYHKVHRGYYYDEQDYSISKLPLKHEERTVLEFTANLLSRYQNVPMFSSFRHITQKIFDALNIHSAISNDQDFANAIQFDQTPVLQGGNWLTPLTEAIRSYKKVHIFYQSFADTAPKERIVHPYILKEFRDRWYLVGISESARETRTYALDRIQHVEVLDVHFPLDPHFNREAYFSHSFGIYNLKGEEPEEVVLSFHPSQAGYFKTQPIHPSQKVLTDSATIFEIGLEVFISEDLIMFIMSYLPRVRVVKPQRLKAEIDRRRLYGQHKHS